MPTVPASPDKFVQWFRAAAPYIHAFGGSTFVIAFGGEAISEDRFVGLNHDLNVLAALGVRLVVVHGARARRLMPSSSNLATAHVTCRVCA